MKKILTAEQAKDLADRNQDQKLKRIMEDIVNQAEMGNYQLWTGATLTEEQVRVLTSPPNEYKVEPMQGGYMITW